MDDTDAPEPESTEPVALTEPAEEQPSGDDPQLAGFDEDLESVASALDALDADDLATAEAFVEKLSVEVDPVAQDPVSQDPVAQDPVAQDPVETDAV